MSRNFYIEQEEEIPAIVFELEAPSGFIPLTDSEKIKELISKQYSKREIDGREYFNSIRVKLVTDYSEGIISLNEIFHIEEKIEPVTLKIILGDWMTASYILSNTTVDSIFNQDFKNELVNYINDYILNNY
jgi:O-phosphoseryl-tRNA(Cys) synthetase